MGSAAGRKRPVPRIGSWLGIGLGLALLIIVVGSCVLENEGRSLEAERTVRRYLAAVAGADADRGWSQLSPSMRESTVARESYIDIGDGAGEAALAVEDVQLVYEDDGFYEFAVTTAEPIDPAYAELLFRTRWGESTIGCQTAAAAFEISVIIGVFSEFAGVTGSSCPWLDEM